VVAGGECPVGPVSAAVVLVLVVSATAAAWVALHPHRISAATDRMNELVPRRLRVWVSKPECRRTLARRLGVAEAAGLALTVGLAVVFALAVVFTQVLDNVLDGEGIAAVDRPALRSPAP
jgi:hypothetical protein